MNSAVTQHPATVYRTLDNDARTMATDGHIGYLSAILSLLSGREADPVDALELLSQMWGSSYARRPQQKAALDDVGRWLERRIRREPAVSVSALQHDVTWLKRLAKFYAMDRAGPERRRAPDRPGFGDRIEELRRARTLASVGRVEGPGRPQLERQRPEPRPVEKKNAPSVVAVPETFAAKFIDINNVRDATRTARDRTRRGKPVKDREVPIEPIDPSLKNLCAGMVVSIIRTQGLSEILQAYAMDGGAGPLIFRVVERDQLVVTRVENERLRT